MAGALESIKLPFQTLQQSQNLDAELSRDQSNAVALEILTGYEADKESRRGWEKQYEEAHKLALQVVERKTTPWENASNVKFPLLTVATLQFSARAYGAMLKGPDIVKVKVVGADPQGLKRARGTRVAQHMSYQMLEECEPWEEEHDRMLMTVPIIGCSFIKTYYDPSTKHNYGQHVLAWDLVVSYSARSLEACERKTHVFYLYEREIRERQLAGRFSNVEISGPEDQQEKPSDQRQGITVPASDTKKPRMLLEQHCYFDFDGDGYPEPYVVTVEQASRKVLRIVNRFKEVVSKQSLAAEDILRNAMQLQGPQNIVGPQVEAAQRKAHELMAQPPNILRIEATEYFTKFPFIPAPDGGFYDLGFGALLGPINESVNTLINQLIDAGTLSNMQAGFLGKGARIKGGAVRFKPGEWKRVEVAGATLKESIVPLPIAAPSPVLFQLLGLLIQYGERIASVTEAMTGGNVGQNTPAYNMQSMLTQGMAVFSGIFKRLYRAFRDEYRKWYDLNKRYLPPEAYFQVMDGPQIKVLAQDYSGDPTDIRPAADPNAALSEEKMRQTAILAQRAMTEPGYDRTQVELRILEASGIADIQEVFPVQQDPQSGAMRTAIPAPENPEFEIKREEEKRRTLEAFSRAKVDEAQIAMYEAQTIKTLAEAGAIDKELAIKQAEVLVSAMQARNKDNEARAKSDRGMAKNSGNGSAG
jgi:chaperonin GroES